jgi:hypothetical protein
MTGALEVGSVAQHKSFYSRSQSERSAYFVATSLQFRGDTDDRKLPEIFPR